MNSRKVLISCILVLLLQAASIAQAQNNIWYFGDHAGLNFNGGDPVALTDGAMFASEGCSSISDENGNLLFYSDGITVWNKLHQIMPNGFGLYGNPSTTQAALITPMPSNVEQFYIFTIDELGGSMNYSIIDITLEGGLGDVTEIKNILLHPAVSEKQAAVQRCDGSIWIISHEWGSDKFFSDKITELGIETSIESNIGSIHIGGYVVDNANLAGQLKISQQGDRLALAIRDDGYFELLDFDISTGLITNPRSLGFGSYFTAWGVEFSPDGTKLYGSTLLDQGVFQFDINAGSEEEIAASAVNIGNSYGLTGILQLGNDGKIYIAKSINQTLGIGSLDRINSPNNDGVLSNYEEGALSLSGGLSLIGLPNFMIKADSTELVVEITGMDSICEGQSTVLTATGGSQYIWSSRVNDTTNSITVSPSNTAEYFVIATATNACEFFYDTITIVVNQKPTASIQGDETICKGDTLQLIASGGISYQWQGASADTSALITIFPITNTIYSILVSDESCTDSASIEILVRDVVAAQFDYFFDNCSNQTIFENLSAEATSFSWNFGNGDFSFAENPLETLQKGNYNITFTTNPGTNCADSLQRTITIDNQGIENLYIPNSFSPNGDGLNDLLVAKGEGVKDFHLQIFSRWGELLFESFDINNKWNGTYKTSYLVQSETFIYSVTYSTICSETNKIEKKGTIALIR